MNNEQVIMIQSFLQGMKNANLGNNDQYMTGYYRDVDVIKEYVDSYVKHNNEQEKLTRGKVKTPRWWCFVPALDALIGVDHPYKVRL